MECDPTGTVNDHHEQSTRNGRDRGVLNLENLVTRRGVLHTVVQSKHLLIELKCVECHVIRRSFGHYLAEGGIRPCALNLGIAAVKTERRKLITRRVDRKSVV